MSSTLRWEPLDNRGKDLPDDLKFVLRKKWGETVDHRVGDSDAPYFAGLRDGGIEGADDVLAAIEKHGMVHIWEEF